MDAPAFRAQDGVGAFLLVHGRGLCRLSFLAQAAHFFHAFDQRAVGRLHGHREAVVRLSVFVRAVDARAPGPVHQLLQCPTSARANPCLFQRKLPLDGNGEIHFGIDTPLSQSGRLFRDGRPREEGKIKGPS